MIESWIRKFGSRSQSRTESNMQHMMRISIQAKGGDILLPEIFIAVFIPFFGTVIGSCFVFFLNNRMSRILRRALTGFAAGVMVAASVWSLIIPAMEQSAYLGALSFVPALVGIWGGILFLLILDHAIPHLHLNSRHPGISAMTVLAVTLHNLPEGMAVGVVLAGWMSGSESISLATALTLSIGIALQNLPEGAIISMPLHTGGIRRGTAFFCGVLSGAIEPIGAILTILLASLVVPVLPYLLSFAAGAMLYVVVEELIPELSDGVHSDTGTLLFTVGFTLMMVLDVALG